MYDVMFTAAFQETATWTRKLPLILPWNWDLKVFSFTDHLDIDYPDYDDVFMIDFDKYSEAMDRLKRDYSGKIKVLKGIEVGIQPHVIEESNDIVKKYDLIL